MQVIYHKSEQIECNTVKSNACFPPFNLSLSSCQE